MKDDFDNGMGIPDDELAGGSAMSEGEVLGSQDGDADLEAPDGEPVGRQSGGARAMQSPGGAGKAAAPRKAAPVAKRKVASKKAAEPAAKKAAKKSAPKKAAKKAARKSPKKAAKKSGSKKKSAKKGKKKGGRR